MARIRNKADMAAWLSQKVTEDLAKSRTHKRKMPPEELAVFMRERSRGCGTHGAGKKPRDRRVSDWD